MHKNFLFVLLCLVPATLLAQQDSIAGGLYKYQKPVPPIDDITSVVLFKGNTKDLYEVQMTLNSITSRKNIPFQHASNECLLIVKSGTLLLRMKDSLWSLSRGSMALLMPAENCVLQNASNEPCEFYSMAYTSKLPENEQRGANAGGSVAVKWNDVAFNPHDKGGIRRFPDRPTTMLERFEMHATTLKEGLKSHDPHTHRAAEIILMLNGNTEMQVSDKFYQGHTGDVYYAPAGIPHAIRNIGKGDCMYFAFQFQ